MSPEDVLAFKAANPGVPLETDVVELQDLLGSVWLYIPWKYVSKQLTTRQKELFADAIETWSERLDPGGLEPGFVPRWWRPEFVEES